MKVEARVSAAFVRRLDAFAAARGMNRSQAIRAAVLEASPTPPVSDLPPAPDRAELLALLGEAARGGSVRATCVLLDELRRDSGGEVGNGLDGLSWIDELARQRRARAKDSSS